jgi:DNA-binding XRE family transcriptional regulator
MADIVSALKDVVRQMARREIRSQVTIARKVVVDQSRDIARLQRLIELQQKKIAALEAGGRTVKVVEGVPLGKGESLASARFSVRSVKSQRRRLKLSAEEFGRLLGVTAQTVYNWEQGKVRPRRSQLSRLLGVRRMGRREALRRLEG